RLDSPLDVLLTPIRHLGPPRFPYDMTRNGLPTMRRRGPRGRDTLGAVATAPPTQPLDAAPDIARWREDIVDEGIRTSYAHLTSTALGGMLSSSAVALITWSSIPHERVLGWTTAVWLNCIGRIILAARFHARPRTRDELRRWHRVLAVW